MLDEWGFDTYGVLYRLASGELVEFNYILCRGGCKAPLKMLRWHIEETNWTGDDPEDRPRCSLIFNDQLLNPDKTYRYYGIRSGDVISVVLHR